MSYPPNYGYPTGQQPPPGQGGYAPPPAGYAPPPGGYAHPPTGFAPPPGGYAPPPAGYAPQPGVYAPHPGGYAPSPAGFGPPPGGYAPPPAAYAPQPGGYAPPPGCYAPPPGGFVPPPSGGFGPTSGACPAGYMPPPSGTCSTYFYIKSLMNGLVLDIEGGVATPERRVVTYTQKHTNADNQLWSEDSMTGTIRSKLAPNMCLTFNGNEMIVKDYKPGKQKQQLTHSGDKIHFRHNANKVLDIAEARQEPLSTVVMYQANGGTNQRWVLEPAAGGPSTAPFSPGPYTSPGYAPRMGGQGAGPAGYVPPPSGPCVSYFYIKSLMNGLVLDIEGGVATSGRRVMTYTQKHTDADNQLWSEDSMTGTIRSKLAPNMCLTFNGSEMIVKDYHPGKQQQQLTHSGDKLHYRHNTNEVLDIAEARREPLSKVVMYQANGGTNQRWVLEPAAGGQVW